MCHVNFLKIKSWERLKENWNLKRSSKKSKRLSTNLRRMTAILKFQLIKKKRKNSVIKRKKSVEMSFKNWLMILLRNLRNLSFLNLYRWRREDQKQLKDQTLRNMKTMLKTHAISALEKYSLILSISKTKKLKMFYTAQLLCKKFNKKEKKQTLKLMKFKILANLNQTPSLLPTLLKLAPFSKTVKNIIS